MHRFTFAVLLSVAFAQSDASAHDASKHKGRPVHGEITAVEGASVTIKTEKEAALKVELQKTTSVVTAGDDHEKTTLAPGQHVEVFGTKLPGGTLVAREVIVHGEK